MVYILTYQNYFTFIVCPIEVGVKVAKVGLVLSLS